MTAATPPQPRPYSQWFLVPPVPSTSDWVVWNSEASHELILEALVPHAELKSIGRARFAGSTSIKNQLWFHYRNYLRQAMNNFEAALTVTNRSSSLLYYYAMLNFAKAELIDTHSSQIADKRVGHGLSFDPTRAKTVSGDALIVRDGVFRLLYERRTGKSIAKNTRLPLKRLLCAIPEIGSQLNATAIAQNQFTSLDMMAATDGTSGWVLLRVDSGTVITENSTTRRLLFKHFREVESPVDWRDHFAISRRRLTASTILESRATVPLPSGGLTVKAVSTLTDPLQDILYLQGLGDSDAFISPYLYKTTDLAMPPSLARYAVTYYASSLVRYRPSAFDAVQFPEQAFLFDSITRECALPMLVDTLSALERRHQFFRPSGSFRL